MAFDQLEPHMVKLEALRDHMVATLAKTFVTSSGERARAEDLLRGYQHFGGLSFVDLFMEYESEVRREARAAALEEARQEYAPLCLPRRQTPPEVFESLNELAAKGREEIANG
mgnify:CR=1 FL=1